MPTGRSDRDPIDAESFPRYLANDPLAVAEARKAVVVAAEGMPALGGSRLLGAVPAALPRLALLYSEPHEEESQPADSEDPTLQWIAFRVIDDATEEPYAGVQLKIKLPSGEVREFTTDGAGRIRIDGLKPGSCDIEKMLDDQAFEVVKVG
jgi:hypothetical protein